MKNSIAKHEAFRDVIQSGKLESMAILIYKELLLKPRTIVHFRESLQMPHQSCTGTLSGLEDSGFVYKYKTITIDKKSFTLYKAETDLDKARQRAIDVENHKKQEWINRGLKRGWFDNVTAKNIAIQLKLEL